MNAVVHQISRNFSSQVTKTLHRGTTNPHPPTLQPLATTIALSLPALGAAQKQNRTGPSFCAWLISSLWCAPVSIMHST